MTETNGHAPQLTVEQMLAKAERPTITVPFRGGTIKLRGLYETERIASYDNWFINSKLDLIESRRKYMRTRMIALCVYDDDPETASLPADAHKTIFENWTSGEVTDVFKQLAEINGESDDIEKDAEKN